VNHIETLEKELLDFFSLALVSAFETNDDNYLFQIKNIIDHNVYIKAKKEYFFTFAIDTLNNYVMIKNLDIQMAFDLEEKMNLIFKSKNYEN